MNHNTIEKANGAHTSEGMGDSDWVVSNIVKPCRSEESLDVRGLGFWVDDSNISWVIASQYEQRLKRRDRPNGT